MCVNKLSCYLMLYTSKHLDVITLLLIYLQSNLIKLKRDFIFMNHDKRKFHKHLIKLVKKKKKNKTKQKKQEAFRERRHLHVCDL